MRMRQLMLLVPVVTVVAAAPAGAQVSSQVGFLTCDLSAGIGLVFVERQTMTCTFRPNGGGPVDQYTGNIVDYGIEIGAVERGHLAWAVVATTQGVPKGALAGTYAGVSASAAVGPGVGANILIGGTGRAFSLQPISVEGEIGANLSAGVRTLSLTPSR